MNKVMPAGGIYVAESLAIASELLRCEVVRHRILNMCKAILILEIIPRRRCELTGTKSAQRRG